MPAIYPYLQLNNLHESYEADASVTIAHWGCALAGWLRECDGQVITGKDLEEVDRMAWTSSGLRCHAVDFLRDNVSGVTRMGLENLAKIALNLENRKVLIEAVEELESIRGSLGRVVHWIAVDDFDLLKYGHHLTWRAWPGRSIYLNTDLLAPPPKPPPVDREASRSVYRTGTESQRRAIREIIELIRVKKIGKIYGGIVPRTTALLIGMSGSGKSWVASTVGELVNLPVFSTTVGSWTLSGNAHSLSTIELLRRHLATWGPSLIVIDEIDKLRQNRNDNLNFTASLWDEIMAVLDGRMQNFVGWERDQISALANSHFIAAGAFQDLYRAALGGDVIFEEQIEDLPKINFTHLARVQFLPDELLNRLGSVIEIRPPASSEVAERMIAIEIDASVSVAPSERVSQAREIVIGCLGMRGLEAYALKLARANLSRTGGAE